MRIAVITGASSGMGRAFVRAMKDLEKRKTVSILGLPVRMQVRLVKHLPVGMVMNTWCRQQGKD